MKALNGTDGLAALVQNQLIPIFMAAKSKVRALADGAGGPHTSPTALSTGPMVAIVALVAALLIVAAGPSQDVLRHAILAVLASAGLFFLLATAVGRVHFAKPAEVRPVDAIAMAWPHAVLITTRLGASVFTNPAFDRLFRPGAGTGLTALEDLAQGQPAASEALFRLARLAERGESAQDMIEVPVQGAEAGEHPMRITLRVSIAPLDLDIASRNSLVLWRFEDCTHERADIDSEASTLKSQLQAYEAAPIGLLRVSAEGGVRGANAKLVSWLNRRSPAANDLLTLDGLFGRQGAEILRRQLALAPTRGFQCQLDLKDESGRRLPVLVASGVAAEGGETAPAQADTLLFVMREPSHAIFAGAAEPADVSFARHFQAAPIGIATVTSSGMIATANRAFAQMVLALSGSFDGPAVEVLCRDAAAEDKARVQRLIADVLSSGAASAAVDFAIGPKSEFGRRLYVAPLPHQGGGREAAILYVIDTTEQRALEAKFTQSQKMEAVGKLAGGIAHDFNNVLTAIIGSADLMLQTHRASDPAHKDIQNIKQCANRAAGLVGKLMAFSRQQPMQLEALSLADILVDSRAVLRTSLGETIEFRPSTDRDLWYVKADRTQIDQVLINLAVNARDAMPRGGTFWVRAQNVSERQSLEAARTGLPVGEYVLIEVEDTGSGMAPDVLDKIFEPFFTTKDIGKGTGLGLATVYGIVKQFSGYIYADSTLGKGTTFRIYLPRHHVENEAELVALKTLRKEAKPDDLTGNATVLIVEDEDMVRSVAVRSLKRLGYNVLEAGNGFEALDAISAHHGVVDIVVSDVVMPEMDGPAFLKEVRKSNPGLKIIFVSGHTNESFKASLDEQETFAFLPKPFSLPQLAAKVKEELARA